MEISDIVGLAGVPVIVAAVELVKPFVADRRFYPLIALALGLVVNLGTALALDTDPRRALLLGLVAGLAASGLYSQGKTVWKAA